MRFARTLCALIALTLVALTSMACSYHDHDYDRRAYHRFDRDECYDQYDGAYRHRGDYRRDRDWR